MAEIYVDPHAPTKGDYIVLSTGRFSVVDKWYFGYGGLGEFPAHFS